MFRRSIAYALVLALTSAQVLAVFPPLPASAATSAAQVPSGPLFGWGANGFGQLGTGGTSFTSKPAPAQGLESVVMADGGVDRSLALLADGTVWTWGAGAGRPVQVPELSGVTAISSGTGHSLALRNDGTVWAWGKNDFGELGDGTTIQRSAPVQVQGLSGATAITAGNLFSLAVTADGSVWSWGYNLYGQLGDGTTQERSRPGKVPGLASAVAVDGGAHFAVALQSDGTVWTWGRNDQGQLGNGRTNAAGPGSTTPIRVTGVSGAKGISAGSAFVLALGGDGAVWAWGENTYGQLGNGQSGSNTLSPEPARVAQLPGAATRVAAGDNHSLALLADGRLASWGTDFHGELGTGERTTTGCWCQPLPVTAAVEGISWMAAGREHTLAVQGGSSGAAPAPAASAGATEPIAAGGEPPAGRYGCITFYSGNYAGDLVIHGGGHYVWYDEPGTYQVDAATGSLSWQSGPAADLGVGGEYRAPGTRHPTDPRLVYSLPTIVLTGSVGQQEGDLISCEFEG